MTLREYLRECYFDESDVVLTMDLLVSATLEDIFTMIIINNKIVLDINIFTEPNKYMVLINGDYKGSYDLLVMIYIIIYPISARSFAIDNGTEYEFIKYKDSEYFIELATKFNVINKPIINDIMNSLDIEYPSDYTYMQQYLGITKYPKSARKTVN